MEYYPILRQPRKQRKNLRFLLSRIIITLSIMPDYSNHVLISIISAGH